MELDRKLKLRVKVELLQLSSSLECITFDNSYSSTNNLSYISELNNLIHKLQILKRELKDFDNIDDLLITIQSMERGIETKISYLRRQKLRHDRIKGFLIAVMIILFIMGIKTILH